MGWIVTRLFKRVRDWSVALAMLALALLIVAKLESEQLQRFYGPFSVVDGDTLAANGERLRIDGIDAPEFGQTCQRPDGSPYACGSDARRALNVLVVDDDWECSGSDRDRYGRLLVICRAGAKDLGELLVSSGFAVADGRYLAAESQARLEGRGIWSGQFERPSEWRRVRKAEEAELAGWVDALMPRWLSVWLKE